MSSNKGSRPSTPSDGRLPPPPLAASRRQLPHRNSSIESSPSPVNLMDVDPGNPSNPNSVSQRNNSNSNTNVNNSITDNPKKTGFKKANSMYTEDSASFDHDSQTVANRMSLPTSESFNFPPALYPDLNGLDFQFVPSTSSATGSTSSSKYENIRSDFEEVTGSSNLASAYNHPTQNLFSMNPVKDNGVTIGPSVTPYRLTSPVPQPLPQPRMTLPPSMSYGWNVPVLPNNDPAFSSNWPGISPSSSYNQLPQNVFHPNITNSQVNEFQNPSWPETRGQVISMSDPFNDMNSVVNVGTHLTPSMPFVPNINPLRSSSPGDVTNLSRETSASPTDNAMNQIEHPMALAGFDSPGCEPVDAPRDQNGDLINLGFALPEHEYLSLDYFDPLYHRARRESVSHGDDASQFTFGDAFPSDYNEQDGQRREERTKEQEELIWNPTSVGATEKKLPNHIGFEAFDFDTHGIAKFGSSEEEFLRESTPLSATMPPPPPVVASPAYDHIRNDPKEVKDSKPDRPPPWIPPKGKHYEHLRKRTFIDPESESFCQMVADLKKQYPSSDQRSNQGYLTNQIQECHAGSIQVKVVVHTSLAPEPVAFTCDTNALVEHVISHVLYTASTAEPQPDTENFILKVYDRTEYLCNDLPLAKFEYTHTCLKLGKDLNLELTSCEQVTRPFIRTKDDDEQMLYFPKEYINADGTAISLESLTILLETFYREVDSLLRRVHEETTVVHSKGVEQSVKAICHNLAKIETTEITKALKFIGETVRELNNPSSKSHGLYQDPVNGDEETRKAINVAMRCSLLEDIDKECQQLVEEVKQLIRMYCRTFLTNFFIGSSVEIPHDHQEVMNVQDSFIVCMASAHRIPTFWHGKFEEFRLVCSLYYGTKKLANDVSTTSKTLTSNLCDSIVWDEWLQFQDTYLCNLPRETRLCVMLCGSRLPHPGEKEKGVTAKGENPQKKLISYPLCAAAIQLFNEKGYLHQGPQLVPLMMGATPDPIMPSCKTLLPDSILLQVSLPEFNRTIFFPVPLNAEIPTKNFKNLIPAVQARVNNVIEKESCSTFSSEEFEILWQFRHYLMEHPSLLPRILKAAKSWDWASLAEIYALLKRWKTLHPMQAFELLLPDFPDIRVREFAADSLNRIPTDDLIHFLPQMIQALKFECYHNSPMAKLLLEQSCKSPRFAHQFFWLLKGVASQEVTFKRRYELMFVALASVAGDSLYQEFKKQEQLVKIMTSLAEKVKAAKDRDSTLKRELSSLHDMLESHGRVLLPYNPSVEVASLDLKSCSYFTSFTFPLKLVFKNSNPKADSHYVMFKVGDDLRQDMLTLQMIRIMDSLWLQQGLDLKMITFSCLATGPKKGILEIITESETLRKIQISCGLTGSFKDRPIKEWLQKHNPTELEYKKAVENFTHSCAGYCVATYVLGVCDRHNDNIMIKQSGHMFHIDFSKFLGDSQMIGGFKRDRVPFVLTSDMAYVINDGGKQGDRFQNFVDLCCQAFLILRRHADLFRSLFILMARSQIPNVNERAVQYVQNALLPGQTDAQATATFTRMIEESMKSVFTQVNFFFHNLAQMKFSSHQEGALLSFVPKAYSEDTDGKITKLELHGCQKRYSPDKHYIFIVRIERENQKVPTYVFRHFSEFVEFRDKLNEMFALVTWPNFSTRVVIGRSNVRTVAESRKVEIANFLNHLWAKAEEISRCELVYTFFHPLLRDEQEAEKSNLNTAKLKEPLVQAVTIGDHSGIKGEIKLSIQYKREALQVMVMHVRGLSEMPELPSPYVKTYLLPDSEKQTKRKTKSVKNTSHPTYNELLQYELPLMEIMLRQLQVTVWDRDVLKENNFLGAVYLKLREFDLNKDNIAWYKLCCLQQME